MPQDYVFITNYSFSQLTQQLEVTYPVAKQFFVDYIFPDPDIFHILTSKNIKRLAGMVELLNGGQEHLKYFAPVTPKPDTKTMVFAKGGKPKYHLDQHCPSIHNNYLDFHIPTEIVDRAKENPESSIVEDYRKWFKHNNFADALKKTQDEDSEKLEIMKINRRYNQTFAKIHGLKEVDENSELLIARRKNSMNQSVQFDFDRSELLNDISRLKSQWDYYTQCGADYHLAKHSGLCVKDDDTLRNELIKLGFSKDYFNYHDISQIKLRLKKIQAIRNEVAARVKQYVLWQKGVEGTDLQKFSRLDITLFGFECCTNCYYNSW